MNRPPGTSRRRPYRTLVYGRANAFGLPGQRPLVIVTRRRDPTVFETIHSRTYRPGPASVYRFLQVVRCMVDSRRLVVRPRLTEGRTAKEEVADG